MKSFLVSSRREDAMNRVGRDVELLEEQWRRHGHVSLGLFWNDCLKRWSGGREKLLDHLKELLKIDIKCRYEHGLQVNIYKYIDEFPDLAAEKNRVHSLIYQEFCVREEYGESLDLEEFCERYPEWKDSLNIQLRYHSEISLAGGRRPSVPRFPASETGVFEKFWLLDVIGEGGMSRVYLAKDLSLGGKRVVLKVSSDVGEEPRTQGVLDHPHIMPVNSVDFENDLRGLSMPYRPGLPLDKLIEKIHKAGANRDRNARTIWTTLVENIPTVMGGPRPDPSASRELDNNGWDGYPINGSFEEGAAWTAMILARALQYAHEMSTFHRDVKPANVLLTRGHGPQLLDFNLAKSPYSVQCAESAMFGGTLPYMAPEQIEAFLDPEQWNRVGAQADIYSLGLVLRELLTGVPPALPSRRLPLPLAMNRLLDSRRRQRPDARELNPSVPHALDAIIGRCLAFNPDDRYPDAISLARDLEAFLARRPLLVAKNPSRPERALNFTIRNRNQLGTGVLIAALAGIALFQAVAPRFKTELTKRPEFLQAVAAVEESRAVEAIEPLRQLAREYPDNPFVQFYLGLSHSEAKSLVVNDAVVAMQEALDQPDHREILLKWASEHAALPRLIENFANAQINHMSEYLLKTQDDPSTKINASSERAYYEATYAALDLALKLEPESKTLANFMSLAEESLGKYDSAYNRLNKLCSELPKSGTALEREQSLEWLSRRVRVLVHMSDQLRGQSDAQTVARRERLIQEGTQLLKECDPDVKKMEVKPTNHQARLVFFYYWISTVHQLALADFLFEKGDLNMAKNAYKVARDLHARIDYFGENHSIEIPQTAFKELWDRANEGARGKPPLIRVKPPQSAS